jgi:hypothetical protein
MFLRGAFTRNNQTFLSRILSTTPMRTFGKADLQAYIAASENTDKAESAYLKRVSEETYSTLSAES